MKFTNHQVGLGGISKIETSPLDFQMTCLRPKGVGRKEGWEGVSVQIMKKL